MRVTIRDLLRLKEKNPGLAGPINAMLIENLRGIEKSVYGWAICVVDSAAISRRLRVSPSRASYLLKHLHTHGLLERGQEISEKGIKFVYRRSERNG